MKTNLNNARSLLPCWLRVFSVFLLLFFNVEMDAQTCSIPSPGNTLSSTSLACNSAPFNLSLQNPTPGTGVTYLWEQADDAAFTVNVVSLGTLPTQTAFETSPHYYRCSVTCANGPVTVISNPVFVDVLDLLEVYAAGLDLNCHGDNLGEVYLSVSGGNGAYTYNWNSGAYSTMNLTNLAAGTYNVLVTDGNGCTASASTTITEPPALIENGIATDASGPGVNDGSIQMNASGGTLPYIYSIDGGANYVSSNIFPSLNPTLYFTRVQDANGCVAVQEVTVNYPSTIPVDASLFMEVTDHYDSIAHIVWGIPSGLVGVQVELERSIDGVNFLPIATGNSVGLLNIMNMPPGFIAPNNTLFLSTESQTRIIYNEVISNLSPETRVFYRAKIMSATTGAQFYTSTKQFLPGVVANQPWIVIGPTPCPPIGFVPAGYTPTIFTSSIIQGCCIITKKLFVKYSCGSTVTCRDCIVACNCYTDPCCVHNCVNYSSCSCTPWVSCGPNTPQYLWVVVSSISIAPSITTTQTNVSCNGGSNGSFTIGGPTLLCKRNKIIGAPPCFAATHPLPWPSSTGQISNVFSGLCAGCYTVMVKDCNGCTSTKVVCITQPTPITLTATTVNTCTCTGSIIVSATGGTPCASGYTYQKLPSGPIQTSPVFSNLCQGCYTIKVTDCNGCTKTIVKCITALGATGISAVKTNVTCNGLCNGTIQIVAPTVPASCLTYSIASSCTGLGIVTTNPLFTGLCAGNYCVRVHNSCTNCDTCICVTISQPSPILLTATSVNTCSCTGSITVSATGGTPCTTVTPYTYQILPSGVPQSSSTFNGLCPGCYTIKVTDCNGCTATIVKCVTSVGSMSGYIATKTNVSCYGGSNGSICITNTAGTVSQCLKYALVTPNCQLTAASVLQSSPCFTGLVAGSYCIKVKDTCTGCDTCICVTITQPSPITLTATSINTCSCNGSITVTATGGTPCSTASGYTYQILPAGIPQASPTFNGLCPGCYTIKVTDCNGCTATIVKCITAVGSPTGLVPNVTNPACFGGTGTICITNSATTTPNPCLKYALVTPNCQLTAASVLQSSPCFTGLVAGSYCVKVKDTCTGCDTCICVMITQPSPITLTATSINTCSCNGAITVTATGGTPCSTASGYTYQILPAGIPQASPTFNGLCPGCYTIKVTDCNGCTATIVKCIIAVGSPTGLVPNVTNPACFGGTGTICITSSVTPANPCLKYALVAPNCQLTAASVLQSSPCFTGLVAGSYCVKVKDTCTGCDTCICVTITQPSPITLTATSINTCSCNGSITVTATGGTPCSTASGYTYQILPAGIPQASPTFNGLCPGCYTIKVTDCNGCTATIVKCITAVGSPTGLVPNVTNPACFGGTGTICITSSVTPTNPCLKYALVTPNCQLTAASVLQSSPCFTGLVAGSYCVKVKDTCTGCDTCICVTITQPSPITLTATSINTCSCNGSITVTATGGTPCSTASGYTYQILPAGIPQASPTFNSLCPGCYTIKVTDCNGCTATIVKCITAVGSPTGLVPNVINPLCNGGTGSICIVNPTGLVNPCLKYALVTPNCQLTAASVLQSSPCFTGLVAGSYCIKVKDTCTGCDTCICVTITQPSPITLTATSVNTCSCNGSITVTATGGTPCSTASGYTYQILPAGIPQASPTFNGLCPGCYTIKVTDCNGCTATIVKCITAVGSPTGLVPNVTNPACFGGTGTICITSSVTPTNPCLKYALVTPNCQLTAASVLQSSPCFTGLVAGSYCVKVKDTCTGCDTCICVTITQPSPITLTATSINTCSCNGSITLTATGGTPCTVGTGYTYQILPAGISQASPIFNGLCPGCYTIKVTDCNGCTATIVKCITAVGSPTGLVPNVTNPACFGGTGTICITSSVTPANPCLKYALVTPNCQLTAASVFQSSPCFTGLVAGSYCVKVKDTCTGCDTCICVTITQPSPITLTATSINTCSCNGSITVTATGGTPCSTASGYTYQILPAGIPQASPIFNGLCPGCYTIKVTDCNGCTATIVKCITAVGSPTGLVPNVTNPACFGGTGTICITSSGTSTNPCLKYALVTPNCQLTAASVLQSSPCFTGLVAGSYCIKVKDTCTGCDTCICVTITQPSPITLTATSINTCSCNGSITVTATGGSPCTVGTGYTYQILPAGIPQASPTFNGLCPGCYTIKVTDCNGCTATIVKCITAVGSPTGLVPNVQHVSCFGGNNGVICITNTSSTPNPCLKYRLVTPNCQPIAGTVATTNPCFTGLTAGSYCIKIKDTCTGCDTCICVSVLEPSPITLTSSVVNSCSCNGSITVNATGGTPCPGGLYSYKLLPTGTVQTSNTFTGLCAGCYTVIVKDCNGCTSSIVQCITGGAPFSIIPIVTQPTCTNPFGQIILVGAFNPCMQFKIGNSCTDPTNPFTPNSVFTNLLPGNYCIQIEDTCSGCDTCICITIVPPSPIGVVTSSTNSCPGLNNGTATATVIGGVAPFTYLWSNGMMTPTIIGLPPGVYTVVVTDANGCTSSATVIVGISPCNPIQINILAFIQGFYNGNNSMNPVVFNQGVSTDPTETDQLTVELRSSLPPYQLVASTVTMLHTNGHATCLFSSANPGNYYLVVKHRNGLQTWSANPINVTSTNSTYDFTEAANKAYGDNMIEVEPGVWAFYSGDINQDENVDLTDFSLYEYDANNFLYGFLPTDLNGDGSTDLLDGVMLENNINNFIYSIHP